jgi:hypothetical protein
MFKAPDALTEHLCTLRGSKQGFGGIPVVLFCGDVQHSHGGPVLDRSTPLPSMEIRWDEDESSTAEQRHQPDRAHALWKKSTTVVILKSKSAMQEEVIYGTVLLPYVHTPRPICDLHKAIVVDDSWSVGELVVGLPCPIGDTVEIGFTIIPDRPGPA